MAPLEERALKSKVDAERRRLFELYVGHGIEPEAARLHLREVVTAAVVRDMLSRGLRTLPASELPVFPAVAVGHSDATAPSEPVCAEKTPQTMEGDRQLDPAVPALSSQGGLPAQAQGAVPPQVVVDEHKGAALLNGKRGRGQGQLTIAKRARECVEQPCYALATASLDPAPKPIRAEAETAPSSMSNVPDTANALADPANTIDSGRGRKPSSDITLPPPPSRTKHAGGKTAVQKTVTPKILKDSPKVERSKVAKGSSKVERSNATKASQPKATGSSVTKGSPEVEKNTLSPALIPSTAATESKQLTGKIGRGRTSKLESQDEPTTVLEPTTHLESTVPVKKDTLVTPAVKKGTPVTPTEKKGTPVTPTVKKDTLVPPTRTTRPNTAFRRSPRTYTFIDDNDWDRMVESLYKGELDPSVLENHPELAIMKEFLTETPHDGPSTSPTTTTVSTPKPTLAEKHLIKRKQKAGSAKAKRAKAATIKTKASPVAPPVKDPPHKRKKASLPSSRYDAVSWTVPDTAPQTARAHAFPLEASFVSSFDVVIANKDAYQICFPDLKGSPPCIELEYPGMEHNCREKFPLLTPKQPKWDYDPLADIIEVVDLVLREILTLDDAERYFNYGCISESFEADPSDNTPSPLTQAGLDDTLHLPSTYTVHTDVSHSPIISEAKESPPGSASPSTFFDHNSEITRSASVTTASSWPDDKMPEDESVAALRPNECIVHLLNKARETGNGLLFVDTVKRYNAILRYLKRSGILASHFARLASPTHVADVHDAEGSYGGIQFALWNKITAQTYDTVVAPDVKLLAKYKAFSDNVYGELLAPFMLDIIKETNLTHEKVFLDLGSGVGNCVVQASLATGCESHGFENMENASRMARDQVVGVRARARLWGFTTGPAAVYEADFTDDSRLNELLTRAHVVLVNNEVFSEELNNKLVLMFLDLPDGALIVSLKPFVVPHDIRQIRGPNPLSIIEPGYPRVYSGDSVSWKGEGGTYHIARINRSLLKSDM